jgi:hypothetical protein
LQGAVQFELQVDDDGGDGSDSFCFITTAGHAYLAGAQ